MDKEFNPYLILGVHSLSTNEEIKKRYHVLAHRNHPDKGGDAQKMKEINQAYDWLREFHREDALQGEVVQTIYTYNEKDKDRGELKLYYQGWLWEDICEVCGAQREKHHNGLRRLLTIVGFKICQDCQDWLNIKILKY